MKELEYTGEFIVPGRTAYDTVQEHLARYAFAGTYVNGNRVLDIACGTGYGSALLRSYGAASIAGVDISLNGLEFAHAHYQALGINFAQADALMTPFPAASFDIVVSFETIEHLEQPHAFLREIHRLLRPGGVLICSSPNKRVYSLGLVRPINPYHVREFTVREFSQLLSMVFHRQPQIFAQHTMNFKQRLVYELDSRLPFVTRMLRRLRARNLHAEIPSWAAVGSGAEVEQSYRVGPLQSRFWRQATFIVAVCIRE